jgi:hypothetical protein
MFSLVTTCMNRESHLRQTLPRWLELPGLGEVVIVDWSTRESLADLVELDPRIRLCRVEDETRWMLAYAVNLGVSLTTREHIIKCDADCIPSSRITAYSPSANAFHAGHWRSGAPLGKACVNGQCVFTRSAFEKVNGYSELFRVYGRDDEDFYDRLAAAGCARKEIAATDLGFLDHSQADRVVNQIKPVEGDPVDAFLQRQTAFHEMTNVVISHYLPWGPWFNRAAYTQTGGNDRFATFKRDLSREIPLSAPLLQQAHAHALVAVVTRLFSLPPAEAARLDRARCHQLLRQHLAKKTAPQARPAAV